MDNTQQKKNWWLTPNPKLKKVNAIVVVILVIVVFSIFKGIFSSSEKNESNTDNKLTSAENVLSPTSIPTQVSTVSLEQKQTDFKDFYSKYLKQAQGMILVQTTIESLAKESSNKADLYLGLEQIQKIQENAASTNMDIKIPGSLKEYKKLDNGLSDFNYAGISFISATKEFKDYVNKEDLSKLSSAKELLNTGISSLQTSKEKIDSVGKELNVDVSTIKGM